MREQALAFGQDGLAKLQFILLVVDRDVTNADIAGMVQIMQRLLKDCAGHCVPAAVDGRSGRVQRSPAVDEVGS